MRLRAERCLLALVLTTLALPALASADVTAELARLDGDPRGRATATLARALERAGVQVVEARGTYRIEGRVRRGALTLRAEGPGGDQRVDVRGETIGELVERAAAELGARLTGEAPPPREEAPAPRAEANPPPAPEDAPEVARERTEAPSTTPTAHIESTQTRARDLRTARSAFDLDLGFTELSRDLVFRDDVFARVADYHARFAPALRIAAQWFPGAHAGSRSPLAWIGVGFAFDRVFGYGSRSADGETRYPTRASSLDADVRFRVPLGLHALTASVGYGREAFFVDASGPSTPNDGLQSPSVPPTHYGYVRIGADAYLRMAGPFYVGASAGLRLLVDRGALDAWFPDNRGAGFDVGARFVVHALSALRVGLAADYHRYVFGLHPEPGDTYVAGGVGDDFLRVTLFVGVRIPELR